MKAKVLRSFIHGDTIHDKGAIIDVRDGQFADWEAVGLVKAAPEQSEAVPEAAAITAGKAKIAKPA